MRGLEGRSSDWGKIRNSYPFQSRSPKIRFASLKPSKTVAAAPGTAMFPSRRQALSARG